MRGLFRRGLVVGLVSITTTMSENERTSGVGISGSITSMLLLWRRVCLSFVSSSISKNGSTQPRTGEIIIILIRVHISNSHFLLMAHIGTGIIRLQFVPSIRRLFSHFGHTERAPCISIPSITHESLFSGGRRPTTSDCWVELFFVVVELVTSFSENVGDDEKYENDTDYADYCECAGYCTFVLEETTIQQKGN
jgi:hypothetical protein